VEWGAGSTCRVTSVDLVWSPRPVQAGAARRGTPAPPVEAGLICRFSCVAWSVRSQGSNGLPTGRSGTVFVLGDWGAWARHRKGNYELPGRQLRRIKTRMAHFFSLISTVSR